MAIKSVIQQLRTLESLESKIIFINSLGIWSCYDLYLGYYQELEDIGLIHYVAYNLFQLFIRCNIDKKMYKYEWNRVNDLYNNAIEQLLNQL
jgi:hypothetical protein